MMVVLVVGGRKEDEAECRVGGGGLHREDPLSGIHWKSYIVYVTLII